MIWMTRDFILSNTLKGANWNALANAAMTPGWSAAPIGSHVRDSTFFEGRRGSRAQMATIKWGCTLA